MPERSYWSREIANLLEISDSTLRKWCLLLEKEGYRFLRDDKNNRAFTDHDVIALRKFKQLTKDKNVTLENAVNIVISMYSERQITPPATPVFIDQERFMERFLEMEKMVQQITQHNDRQESFNQALLEKLDQRNEQFNQFVEIYRQQMQLAAAKENKKKWYQRLLKGD